MTRVDADLMSLMQCARALETRPEFASRPPAYITLKRWSEAGLLNAAKVMEKGKRRARFKLREVLRIALARTTEVVPGVVSATPSPEAGVGTRVVDRVPVAAERHADAMPEADRNLVSIEGGVDVLRLIAATMIEIRDEVRAARSAQAQQPANASQAEPVAGAAIAELLGKVDQGLRSLKATERNLMIKYDEASTHLRARLETVEAASKLPTLPTLNASTFDLVKSNSLMSRVADLLDQQLRARAADPNSPA